jgi:NADH-quinone oxidoreductase subunit I
MTALGARLDTTSTGSNASGAAIARSPAPPIVLTRKQELHMERRAESILTKEMLLAIGARYEGEIEEDRLADAPYR